MRKSPSGRFAVEASKATFPGAPTEATFSAEFNPDTLEIRLSFGGTTFGAVRRKDGSLALNRLGDSLRVLCDLENGRAPYLREEEGSVFDLSRVMKKDIATISGSPAEDRGELSHPKAPFVQATMPPTGSVEAAPSETEPVIAVPGAMSAPSRAKPLRAGVCPFDDGTHVETIRATVSICGKPIPRAERGVTVGSGSHDGLKVRVRFAPGSIYSIFCDALTRVRP